MIYISSACSPKKKIGEAVTELAQLGFQNIELTGGTNYYDGYEQDLLSLQEKYNLNYLVHNYFPPPQKHFVLNLASLNDELYQQSIEHAKNAIALTKKLGGKKLGFHAGFFIDIKVKEIGKSLSINNLFDRKTALEKFQLAWSILENEAGDKVTLYLENNVLSQNNFKTYQYQNPLMLTHYDAFRELKQYLNFNLLLDVAHLKVSANSLGLNFIQELDNMIKHADYIHLSNNNGIRDQNLGFLEDQLILNQLKKYDFSNKNLTLEIYKNVNNLQNNYQLIEVIFNLNPRINKV